MHPLRLETERPVNGVILDKGGRFCPRDSRRDRLRLESDDLRNPFILRFINATDDEARAEFLTAYGCLMPGKQDCSRKAFKELQREMFRLLSTAGTWDLLDSRGPAKAVNMIQEKGDRFEAIPAPGGIALRYESLLALMRAEVRKVVDFAVRLDACDHCHVAFLTGSITGRKGHAKFCSNRCRAAALRARGAA